MIKLASDLCQVLFTFEKPSVVQVNESRTPQQEAYASHQIPYVRSLQDFQNFVRINQQSTNKLLKLTLKLY